MCWSVLHIRNVLVTVFLFWQSIYNVDAIKCFICDSSVNSGCTDLKSNLSIVSEECSLNKMKSMDSWLSDFNKIEYFPTHPHETPSMHCQKVVAKDPNTGNLITARFCQITLADSDPCYVLRNQLNNAYKDYFSLSSSSSSSPIINSGNDANNDVDENEKDEFFCSFCDENDCNGSTNIYTNSILILIAFAILATNLLMSGNAHW